MEQPDWNLPGMENISEHDIRWLKKSIENEDIVKSIHCLGWAFWPTKNVGYYDERTLRVMADFIEIQNKPFWDEYDAYCEQELRARDEEELPVDKKQPDFLDFPFFWE